MEIPKELQSEIWEYCRLNNITNVDEFTLKVLKQGFTVTKFGSSPSGHGKEPEVVEKLVEVIKEVPVEVEKLVEVIKEVVVEKEVFVTDDEANLELKKEVKELETLLADTIKDFDEGIKANDQIHRNQVSELDGLESELATTKIKLDELEKELEAEKAKPKKDNDIYSEKKGILGSNISDLWNNKKK